MLDKLPGFKLAKKILGPIKWKWKARSIIKDRILHEQQYYVRHCMDTKKSPKGEDARLVAMYHVIEKGLTMPQRRLGFGQPMVMAILAQIELVLSLHERRSTAACDHAKSVLAEYYEIHRNHEGILKPEVEEALKLLLADNQVSGSNQSETTAKEYWSHLNSNFEDFSASRHSLRSFSSTPVSEEQIRAAVSLANNAPSACNRQPCKVYCVEHGKTMDRLLEIQGGNRGFGHLADKLIVLTCNRSCFMTSEFFSLYVNGGIYLMNLVYSLHFNKVGTCILNWTPGGVHDDEAHKLIDIPEEETIIALVACGSTPEEFHMALSPRKSTEETLLFKK
jgi:nitroreductase